jgi:hypothetical protein
MLNQHNCIVIKAYNPANLLPMRPINTANQPQTIIIYAITNVNLLTPIINGDW